MSASPIRFISGTSSLGTLLLASSAQGLCALLLGDNLATLERDLARRFPGQPIPQRDEGLMPALEQTLRYLDNPLTALDLPLDPVGSAFQQRVWEALRQIPLGKTVSYQEIARQLGQPKAFRAVANACGANPLAVIVPCHRVLRQDGSLGGYRWGLERKRQLLEREAQQ
ncbi:AraC family transcriptional regulator of adaptative response/methylated-DNA-[protein]-cysteine methyltransferase [Pseudomonas sp. SJZ080]|uniref:methylated-DNA--[protein]-cysteine S-methyltransferase n=1 Tax=Pseudomonas sp. SJZ080 TaxID=2572888 RepID=UPI00119A36EA|nr:methylated-DNA--[protein]-cysteine S-methyltransferase [Pseudomonas sp. SJZ080]TWC59799.1 AraC family transcriptional regulator of adaptative response/methylated-DNA-[protein]-cysteine methyltransferase [Pseudomonas sp. SJZ080]